MRGQKQHLAAFQRHAFIARLPAPTPTSFKPPPCRARISGLEQRTETLVAETLVTGQGPANVCAGAHALIRRSPKGRNCGVLEVSGLFDLFGSPFTASNVRWADRETLQPQKARGGDGHKGRSIVMKAHGPILSW
jgi:hypothetical protein